MTHQFDTPRLPGRQLSWTAILLAAAAILAGCGSKPSAPFGASDADHIECRIGDATAFERVCVIERAVSADGLVLTVRHPDGGFRRLLVTTDGRGVVAADGAEPATVAVESGDGILVAIGGDNYRLPATIRSASPK